MAEQTRLAGYTIGVVVAPGFEDLESWVPVMRLRAQGAHALVISMDRASVTGKHCLTAQPDIAARKLVAAFVEHAKPN